MDGIPASSAGREGFLGIPNHSFCLPAIFNNSTIIEMYEDKFWISHGFKGCQSLTFIAAIGNWGSFAIGWKSQVLGQ